MTVGIRVDGPRPKDGAVQGDGVKIRGVVPQRRASATRVDHVHHLPRRPAECRRRCRGAGESGVYHRGLAARGAAPASAATGAIGDGESHLPGKIGTQEIGQVRAVRLRGQPVVLARAEIVEEKVTLRVPQHRGQGVEAQGLFRRCVEQTLDPGREKGICRQIPLAGAPVPRAAAYPDLLAGNRLAATHCLDPVGPGLGPEHPIVQCPRRPSVAHPAQGRPGPGRVRDLDLVQVPVGRHCQDFHWLPGFRFHGGRPDPDLLALPAGGRGGGILVEDESR